MSDTLTLASAHDVADLQTFLQRAERLGCALTRLRVSGSHLVALVCVLEKQGLLDTHPNVLGMRVVELSGLGGLPVNGGSADEATVDALVETRAVLDRLARAVSLNEHTLEIPLTQPRAPWAGSTPPRSGWLPVADMAGARFVDIARAGIDEVASANGLGTNIVTEVRRTVWSRLVDDMPGVVSGLAFALFGLGFVIDGDDDEVRVTSRGSWIRATTRRGIVLARS
jgi:hypothetical protein